MTVLVAEAEAPLLPLVTEYMTLYEAGLALLIPQ